MNLNKNDEVISCKYLESGVRFSPEGVRCCCANTFQSPVIISSEEMNNGSLTYDLVVSRRKQLFEAINRLNDTDIGDCKKCNLKYKTKYKNISFEYLGGHGLSLSSGFNIQHFSLCNLRCNYCMFTQQNNFVKPTYNNIIDFIELFRKRGKLKRGEWIEYNGGEPTLLENFEEILNYLIENKIGMVSIFSNAVKYSQAIYNYLKKNKIFLTVSLDAGTPSTFKRVRGVDAYDKVLQNCIRYKNSGTTKLFLKYIICEENMTEDDLWGFVFSMLAIRPARVYICPSFYYCDKKVSDKEVIFGARMWYLLEKYGQLSVYIQSDDMKGDKKFSEYSKLIRQEYKKLKKENPFNFSSSLVSKFKVYSERISFIFNYLRTVNIFKLIKLKLDKMKNDY